MAIKQSATFRNTVPNGTFGTISKAVGSAIFAADAAGTEVQAIRLEAGTKIFGFKAHHANLGAGTSIKVGYAYVDADDGASDDDAFCTGATTAAGVLEYAGTPFTLTAPAIVTVTSAGIATGEVTVIPEYEYRGV
jgi:hypothetical protein